MRRVFEELKRRNVFRVGAAYLVVGWLVLQVAAAVVTPLRLPEWTTSLVILLLGVGFPVALLCAWAFETPPKASGPGTEASEDAKGFSGSAPQMIILILGVLSVTVGAWFWQTGAGGSSAPAPAPRNTAASPSMPETVEQFLAQTEPVVGEASGAAVLNGNIYVVDDEKPYVYEFRYSAAHKKSVFIQQYTIVDARAELGGIKAKNVENIHDMEGAAAYKGHLYLVTSHSLTAKGQEKAKRELLVEIGKFETPNGKEAVAHVSRAVSLIDGIRAAVDKLLEQNAKLVETDQQWNLEGFAIDQWGTAYFGFRNPIVEKGNQAYALILTAKLNEIFLEKAVLMPILVRLSDSGKTYGISSLEFDQGKLFILGNSPRKLDALQPRLWKMVLTDALQQEPVMVKDWTLTIPAEFQAKPEALVLPEGGDHGFIFLDARGHGGQRVFERRALGADTGQ